MAAWGEGGLDRARALASIQMKLEAWVMVWKQGNGALPGHWIGPMKVVVHENNKTVWTTMAAIVGC